MKEQEYLKLANEAGRKIKEINQLISGTSCPEEGSLLGNVVRCVYSMVQIYIAPIVREKVESDDLNNLTSKFMFAESKEFDRIVKEYIADFIHGK